ncbi:MAG: hypothetical protein GX791_00515 [Synergistaceae bacterium]|nr:hypothetical protein [Synergistaceae bacterium]
MERSISLIKKLRRALFLLVLGSLLPAFLPAPVIGAESVLLPVDILIPEASGVKNTTELPEMTIYIASNPREEALSLSLTATGTRRKKLTGRLSGPLPSGLTLTLEIRSAASGSSTGPQRLDSGEVVLLTGFSGIYAMPCRAVLRMEGDQSLSRGTGTTGVILTVSDM